MTDTPRPLRIGYLRAGFTPAELMPSHGDYLAMFQERLSHHAPHITLSLLEVQEGGLPDDPGILDGYLCSGSVNSVYDDTPWIGPLCRFVQQLQQRRIPLFGVCFGHQLIAHALGGRVEKATSGWGLGARELRIHQPLPWMVPARESVTLFHTHQDQVMELPPGGERLASAGHCPVAMLRVGNHMVGVQGHPEFTVDYMAALMTSREARIPPATLADARATLGHPTHGGLLIQWMAAFFAGPR